MCIKYSQLSCALNRLQILCLLLTFSGLQITATNSFGQASPLTITDSEMLTSSTLAFQNGFNLVSLRSGNPYIGPANDNIDPEFRFLKYFGFLGNDNNLEYDSYLTGRFDLATFNLVSHTQGAGTEISNPPDSATPFTFIQGDPFTENNLVSESSIEIHLSRASTFTYNHVLSAIAIFYNSGGGVGYASTACTFSVVDSEDVIQDSYTVADTSLLPDQVLIPKSGSVILPPGDYTVKYRVENFSEVYGTFPPGSVATASAQGFFIDGGGFSAQAIVLPGDYNGDGFVSQPDLDLVLLNWGSSTQPAGWVADEQFDGFISQQEKDIVLLNWGNSAY